MKKIFFIAIFSTCSTIAAFCQVQCTVEPGGTIGGCDGSGVCGCTGDPRGHDLIAIQGSDLIITINAESLNARRPGKMAYFKGKSNYTFDQPFKTSPEITRALKAKSTIEVKKGTYPMTFDGKVYVIRIPISYYNAYAK